MQSVKQAGPYKAQHGVVDGSFSPMRFINDCRGTGLKPNTIYKQNGDIYTSRRVFADEEFLIEYGKYYWGARLE